MAKKPILLGRNGERIRFAGYIKLKVEQWFGDEVAISSKER